MRSEVERKIFLMMKLLPIDIDETQNSRFRENTECLVVLNVFTDFYKRVGFSKPWIAYFVPDDTDAIIGGGGYKGKPKDGKIEISYGTFKKYEGQGVGTEICRQLIALALQTDPSLTITARTLPENEASIRILKRNGFVCHGLVFDDEDGEVFEWIFDSAV
jgi:RimJ/RimL family protein N-acetyltransferase